MTLREALDLLELNERTLEQSMLESSLQNRLEHTELRHVLRVFEAYRKVNAFLNPSFNTRGDARMTIIDESVPGGPMLEVTRAAVPTASAVMTVSERDTFSDTMIETLTATDAMRVEPKSTLTLKAAAPRAEGVNLFVMLGLIAAAFSVGMVVLGPTMSLIFKPSTSSALRPAPSVSSLEPVAPVVTAPPVAPVVTPSAPIAQPAPPVAVAVKPAPPAAPIKPAITKLVVRPPVTTEPPAVAQVKPRVTAPRVTAQARVASRRAAPTPRASSRVLNVAAPARRTVNQRQFVNWDNAGAVLRYRSWTLVPDAVRGLSTNAFRAAVFVARDPASLPDIPR